MALTALTAGVTAGINASGVFKGIGDATLRAAATGAAASGVSQGIGVVTGLQDKFDWAGVVAAGVGAGVGQALAKPINSLNLGKFGTSLASNMAGGIANAASRSLVNGSDFGDNLMAALPDILGNTIGNALGDAVAGRGRAAPGEQAQSGSGSSDDAMLPIAPGALGMAGLALQLPASFLKDLPLYAEAERFGAEMSGFLSSLPETSSERADRFAQDIESGSNPSVRAQFDPAHSEMQANPSPQLADGTIVVTGRKTSQSTGNIFQLFRKRMEPHEGNRNDV